MQKAYFILFVVTGIISSSCIHKEEKVLHSKELSDEWTVYSGTVGDSFVISVQLPDGYGRDSNASPSLWYNNFYLYQLAEKLKSRKNTDTLHVITSVGGEENAEWDIAPGKKLGDSLSRIKGLQFQHIIYNDLGHMDVAAITFTKALQSFYTDMK